MKIHLLTILISLSSLSFNKVIAQNHVLFKIDGSRYAVDLKQLNDLYGRAFNKLVYLNTCKEKDLELWTASYETFKARAIDGEYSWDVYHDKIVNFKYTGNSSWSDADNGIIRNKTAKGNPNKKVNHAARMALLHGIMADFITNLVTDKKIKE